MNSKSHNWDESANIAKFYGFEPSTFPLVTKQDIESTKGFDQDYRPEEKAALIRNYFENKLWSSGQPVMQYREYKKAHRIENALFILGSTKSVCECLLIETAISILENTGYKEIVVRINSIGDKESMNSFSKKLSLHIRKNYSLYPQNLRQDFKKDIFSVFKKYNEYKEFADLCPKSIDFLSENSRKHFKEVLEFLEMMGIPYRIDSSLIGDPIYASETVFAIDNLKDEENLAYGFRFNRMGKKIDQKKEIACSFVDISVKPKKILKKVKLKNYNPKAYLVQFGPEAKLKAFLVLKELFKSKTYISHAIIKDKLGSQIGIAESSNVPYILLLGQKEALEESIVIRNNSTRAQEIVPISQIGERLREL